MPLVDALDPERASQTIKALLARRRRAVAQGPRRIDRSPVTFWRLCRRGG
ncbi:hypothetical protein [Sorangium sp. So ce426]